MIIGIDGNEANVKNRVGVNVYAFGLLKALYESRQKWSTKHSLIVFLKNPPLSDLPKETKFFKYRVLSGGGLWILTRLMPYLLKTKDKPNVFFSPSHYIPPFVPMPVVCSIMDLGYLESSAQFTKKDFWQLKYWSAISILASKSIIAISNSTKKDIVRHYPFALRKTYVTHLGYDKKRFNTDISNNDVRRVKNKYSIVSDYLVFISTLKPSKNVEGLLEAYALIKGEKPKLVIAGKKGWLFDPIFQRVKKLKLENSVIFTDFFPEKDKPGLIKGAKAFILPSFWEGFGLDVLSAMACGVAVVVSNVGSLPEVCGDAGVLVNPHDTRSIAKGIEKILTLPKKEYNYLVDKGLMQAGRFSWEKTAEETLAVLENAVK